MDIHDVMLNCADLRMDLAATMIRRPRSPNEPKRVMP